MSTSTFAASSALSNMSSIQVISEDNVSALKGQKVGTFCGHTVEPMKLRSDLSAMLHSNIIPRQQAAKISHGVSQLLADVQLVRGGLQKLMGTSEFKNISEELKKALQKDSSDFTDIKNILEATKARAESVITYVPTSGEKLNLAEEVNIIASATHDIAKECEKVHQVLENNLRASGLLDLFQTCCNPKLQYQQVFQQVLQQQQQQSGVSSSASTASTGTAAPSSKAAQVNTPLTTVAAGREKAALTDMQLEQAKQRQAIITDANKTPEEKEALLRKLDEGKLD